MSFYWNVEKPSDLEQRAATDSYQLDTSSWLGLTAKHTFERSTTPGLIAEEMRISQAEMDAGTYYDPREDIGDDSLVFDPGAAVHPFAMTEEEFKAGGYDRGGRIEYTPRMTPQRAQILAETFDRREHEAQLLERSATPLRRVLGFGASLLASLPDPVNLIPVGGAAIRGASLGARALAGAKAGVLGTALADAIILPEAKMRGEDIGFADLALDLTFGGLIGGGIGSAGGLLHNRRVRAMGEQERSLAAALEESGYDVETAAGMAKSAINITADTYARTANAEAVRNSIAGLDREAAGRLLDKSMVALRDGQDLDLAAWTKELGADGAFRRADSVMESRDTREVLEATGQDEIPQISFGKLSPEYLQGAEKLDVSGDMRLFRDGNLVLPSKAVYALYNSGLLKGRRTADEVMDVLMQAVNYDQGLADSGAYVKPDKVRRLHDKLKEIGFLSVDAETGKPRLVAETSVGSEKRRLVREMTDAGMSERDAEAAATLHTAQARAFQNAYGVDAARALTGRSVAREGEGGGPGTRIPVASETGSLSKAGTPDISFHQNGEKFQRPGAVGRITPEVAATLQLDKPGEIVLDDAALSHIEKRHGKELRSAGFRDARELVTHVMNNTDAVYQGNTPRKYELVAKAKEPHSRAVIRLEFSRDGDFYKVATAGPVRPDLYKNKTPLWERAQSNHSGNPEPVGTPRAITGQSDVSGETVPPSETGGKAFDQPSRGRVEFSGTGKDSTARIFLSPDADLSTIPHESAHIFLRELESVVENSTIYSRGLEQAQNDLATLRKWAGVKEHGKLTARENSALQESTARGFEQYLYEGKAPAPGLNNVFQRMADWLKSIYADIKAYVAAGGDLKLNDEVRAVFDRMLDADAGKPGRIEDVPDFSPQRRDFSRARPLPVVNPPSLKDAAKLDKAGQSGQSAKSGQSGQSGESGSAVSPPYTWEAERLMAEGKITAEDAAQMKAVQDEIKRVDTIEEAGLGILQCAMGV